MRVVQAYREWRLNRFLNGTFALWRWKKWARKCDGCGRRFRDKHSGRQTIWVGDGGEPVAATPYQQFCSLRCERRAS